ncbi:MAG: WYL domain-containing protein [Bacillota bacterium]
MTHEKLFNQALEAVCKVRFHYIDGEGEETDRTIRPIVTFRYKRLEGITATYVLGFCELDSDYRTFRFDRMSKVTIVNETYPVVFFDIESHLGRREDDFSGFIFSKIKIIKYVKGMPQYKAPPTVGKSTPYGEPGPKPIKRLKPLPRDSEYPKLWESSKLHNPTGKPCKCRSPLEEEILSALDDDDKVYGYEIEPFRIQYWAGSKRRFYIPDLLVRYADGRKIIVEIKSEWDVAEPINQAKFKAIEQYANENGYGFEVWTGWPTTPVAWKEAAASGERPRASTLFEQTGAAPSKQNNYGCLVLIVVAVLLYLLVYRN